MSDYIKSQRYIYANLCHEVSRVLYEALIQKGEPHHRAIRRAHGGNMSLYEISQTLTALGAHLEVTVKFIGAPDVKENQSP